MPPKNSSFDQNIFSAIEREAVSNMRQNAPNPIAIISRHRFFAPFTNRRCHASNATKNETNAVTRKNTEYIVKIRFIIGGRLVVHWFKYKDNFVSQK